MSYSEADNLSMSKLRKSYHRFWINAYDETIIVLCVTNISDQYVRDSGKYYH